MINAIVLAAGESKRMGMPKPLLLFRGLPTTFVDQIVSVLRDTCVDRITVVLGAEARKVRESAVLSGVDIVINEDYARGQLSSLIAGLRSMPPETEAIVLCLVDNPLITREMVNRVIEAFRETGQPIVVPVFQGQRGHPALFARSMFDELLNAPADEGARHVVQSNGDKVLEVDVPDPAVLTRIDTPEDYRLHFGLAPLVMDKSMMELRDALELIQGIVPESETERIELSEALGRILKEDIVSDVDMPPFDKATVDGYACRRADLGNPLTVVETIPAGRMPEKAIGPNQCAKIMTGAAVPQGADCVVMIEQTERVGPTEVPDRAESVRPLRSEVMLTLFHQAPTSAPRVEETVIRFTGESTPNHISHRAMDIKAGQVVLQAATRIGPAHVAVLASVGCAQLGVARLPKVGVIATGSEIVPPAAKPGPAQIRNSNSSQLLAQLAAMGIRGRDYGVVRDIARDIDAVLKRAFTENDTVIISGGVSVGEFDLVADVLRANDAKLLLRKLAIKPGKPVVVGLINGRCCFGLPGNPVSTFVVFELLVKPFLYRFMGHAYSPVQVEMRLDARITRKDADRQSWIPVKITSEQTVKPVEYHGSAHSLALCEADGLISMEIGVMSIEPGTAVRVRLL